MVVDGGLMGVLPLRIKRKEEVMSSTHVAYGKTSRLWETRVYERKSFFASLALKQDD